MGQMKALMTELGLVELSGTLKRLEKIVTSQAAQLQQQDLAIKALNEKLDSIDARTQDLEAFNAAPIRGAESFETPEEFAREASLIIENDKSLMLVYPAGTTEDDKKAAEEMLQPAPTAITNVITTRNGKQLRKATFPSALHARAAASREVKKYLRNKQIYVERVLTPKQSRHKQGVDVPLAKTIRSSNRFSAACIDTKLIVWIKDSYGAGKVINTAQFNADNVPKTFMDPRLQALLHEAYPPSTPTSPRSPKSPPAGSSNQQGDKRNRETVSPTPNKDPKRFAPGSPSKSKSTKSA